MKSLSLLLALFATLPPASATPAVEPSAPSALPVPAAAPTRPVLRLPAKPSELLRAPLSRWEPLLKQLGDELDKRAKQADALPRAAQIELGIYRLMLAQTRQSPADVIGLLAPVRALQDNEAGRQTSGLLNDVLAQQALAGGDGAWLKLALKTRVLAMPWAEVEPAIRTLRDQLAGMQESSVDAFVVAKLDLSAGITTDQVTESFVMQLMGLRFQVLEVLPNRAALLVALDEAIAHRSALAGTR